VVQRSGKAVLARLVAALDQQIVDVGLVVAARQPLPCVPEYSTAAQARLVGAAHKQLGVVFTLPPWL
jgi:hypothetical protein